MSSRQFSWQECSSWPETEDCSVRIIAVIEMDQKTCEDPSNTGRIAISNLFLRPDLQTRRFELLKISRRKSSVLQKLMLLLFSVFDVYLCLVNRYAYLYGYRELT